MPASIPVTGRQRAALLALPDSEAAVVAHHSLDAGDIAAIKARFGFQDLSRPTRADLMTWLVEAAMPVTDGCALFDRLLEKMRWERIVIPGISVVERMAAEAMIRAETDLIAAVDRSLDVETRRRLDTLVDGKVHDRQSRLSWLREPQPRVAPASLDAIVEKVTLIRWTGVSAHPVDPAHEPRLVQFAREGSLST